MLCPAFVDTPLTDYLKDEIAPEEMIRVEDVAEGVRYLLKLSRYCVIPELVFARVADSIA